MKVLVEMDDDVDAGVLKSILEVIAKINALVNVDVLVNEGDKQYLIIQSMEE